METGRRHWLRRAETGGPFLLLVMAMAGLVLANSPFREAYALLEQPLGPLFGRLDVPLPPILQEVTLPSLAELVTIGPMTLFFLTITLELKQELVAGHLASFRQALLPCLSALGGVVVPACLYGLIAAPDPALHSGWAIPVATDAAFTLPILLALGRHVSEGGRVWLMALAIFDDVLGILIIALFYGGTLHVMPLLAVAGLAGSLALAGRAGVGCLWLYGAVGVLLWLAMLGAGLHPTLAGVVVGLCLPTRARQGSGGGHDNNARPIPAHGETPSPLRRVEHLVAPWVTWLVLPLFGFVTVGVPLLDVPVATLSPRLILAVAAGLVLGKSVGIFAATALATACRLARLPAGTTWPALWGLCLLCGLGFTVSLFMASLAFPASALLVSAKIGILAGSLLAALTGWLWLRFVG